VSENCRGKPNQIEQDQFTKRYPSISRWIKDGLIEIGRDGYSSSMIRACDEGGTVWEGGARHKSMDKILQEAEEAIAKWFKEND
jgi:hypothetical protein